MPDVRGQGVSGATLPLKTLGEPLCLLLFLVAPGIPWLLVASLPSLPLPWRGCLPVSLCGLSFIKARSWPTLIQNDFILIFTLVVSAKIRFPDEVTAWGSGWTWVLGIPFTPLQAVLYFMSRCSVGSVWILPAYQTLLFCDVVTDDERFSQFTSIYFHNSFSETTQFFQQHIRSCIWKKIPFIDLNSP